MVQASRNNYDYVAMGFYTFDCLGWPYSSIPEGGGTNYIDEFTLAVSGAAGTASIAAARMGLKTLAVGGVGSDLMGDWVMQRLKYFGVDTACMQQQTGWKTSSSIVTTRKDGSRPALHMLGATADFYVGDDMIDRVIDSSVVHVGGVGVMQKMDQGRTAEIMKRAVQNGSKTTVDIFAGSPEHMKAVALVLPYTDYFMPSIEEAQGLTGLTDISEMAEAFFKLGAKCCVFTLGNEGASYHHKDGTKFKLPAFAVDVKCTCGCGDAFNAGFAVGLVKRFDPQTTVKFAQATAALNATGLGSQAGVQSFEHTLNFMKTTPTR